MSHALRKDLKDAGVPTMAVVGNRVALGGIYCTPTGQWVVDNGIASWEGPAWQDGVDPAGPDAATITTITTTIAGHTPPTPKFELPRILEALAKAARGKVLSTDDENALDQAEGI